MRHSYFDHNASSPVAPAVLLTLAETLSEIYGNPSSIHYFGQTARQRVEAARRTLADRFSCTPREIVFTSGGTESDNLAIFGTARQRHNAHIVTSAIEHPAVLGACSRLEREGFAVTYLVPDANGQIDPSAVRDALKPTTALISIMHANNETGVVLPMKEIAQVARAAGVLFHSDGVQAAGKLEVSLRDDGPDLYSISGHKFGAPKGAGALFVRKGVNLEAMLYGGRHERERRAGTENVPGIAALGQAAALDSGMMDIAVLRGRLESGILANVPATSINGRRTERLPNTSNIRFEGIEGEAMTIALDLRGFAVSSGSACSSGSVEPSHVLLAMGLSPEDARSSVRFSLGRGNTVEEVDALIEAVKASAAQLRAVSATWREEVAHA